MLLYRQMCLLAGVAGVAAFREPGPGLVFLALLLFLEPKRSLTFTGVVLLATSFLLGAGYAKLRDPAPPLEPAWLAHNLAVEQSDPYGRHRPAPLFVTGTVGKVTPLSGGRIRFFLRDLTPAASDSTSPSSSITVANSGTDRAPYGGNVLMTLRGVESPPLSGQTFTGTIRLNRIRTLENPGTWNAAEYWRDRGTWIRGWPSGGAVAMLRVGKTKEPTAGSPPLFTFSGAGDAPSRLHATLKERLLHATSMALGTEKRWGGTADSGDGNKGQGMTGTAQAMLPALLFGDRSFLSAEQSDRIARSSLAHSLALSGLHLGYAVAIGAALAWLAGRVRPGIFLRMPRQRLAIACALPLALVYVWLGQAPVSLLRAACMFCFWALLLFWNKPGVMLDGLVLAVGLLTLVDPTAVFDISLQLSALSVAVIALFLPLLRRLAARPASENKNRTDRAGNVGERPFLRKAALEILAISLLIQFVTGPLVLKTFGVVALWFPLNLLWLPVLGIVVMPLAFLGLLLSSLALYLPASWCLSLAGLPCQGLMRLLETMDGLGILAAPALMRPHWTGVAGWLMFCLGLLLLARNRLDPVHGCREGIKIVSAKEPGKIAALFRRHPFPPLPDSARPTGECAEKYMNGHAAFHESRHAVALLLAGLLLFLCSLGGGWYGYLTHPVGIRLLDVGQGQAVLVEWPGGRALIDGGGFSGSEYDVGKGIVAPALTDNRPARVNILAHTHPDFDHMGGLMYVLESFAVDEYVGNGDSPSRVLMHRWQKALTAKNMRPAVWKAGDVVFLAPSLRLEVLWPRRDAMPAVVSRRGEDTNNASLVMRLVWKERPLALLCGDAGLPVLRELATTMPERLRADVLILPHHGSASGLCPEFYRAVSPKIALASCGRQNRWGFPARPVTDWFEAQGIPLYSTSVNGQISIHWDGQREILRANRPISQLVPVTAGP